MSAEQEVVTGESADHDDQQLDEVTADGQVCRHPVTEVAVAVLQHAQSQPIAWSGCDMIVHLLTGATVYVKIPEEEAKEESSSRAQSR